MFPNIVKKLAKPMLFAAAIIWGSSFFIMKNVLDDLPVAYVLSIRFIGAAVLLSLVFWKKWKLFTWDYLWRGAIVGGCLFAAYYVQTWGLVMTTPSKNAFLTSVYCVLVPFLYWAVMKKRPDRYNVIAALLCVSGVGFVGLSGSLSSELAFNIGDLLTLVCAFFYAAHIVTVAKLEPEKDIYLLTVFQFIFTGLYALIVAVLTEKFPLAALGDGEVRFALAYLCVIVTAAALLFQNVGQVNSDPASASVILSLESVFGVIFSVICYGDRVTLPMLVGFCLIFVAVVCSETKFSFLNGKA